MQFRFADHRLDTDKRELCRGSELIGVEPQVFDQLVYLAQNRDRVVSKDDLIASLWNIVFVFGSYDATVRRTGRRAACEWLHVFWVSDGKISRFREYNDTARFAEAWRS